MKTPYFTYHDFMNFVRSYDFDIIEIDRQHSEFYHLAQDMNLYFDVEKQLMNILRKSWDGYAVLMGNNLMSTLFSFKLLDDLVARVIGTDKCQGCALRNEIENMVEVYKELRTNITAMEIAR